MDKISQVKQAIEEGRITEEEGVAEIAFALNANEPESLKMGWPLITSIKQAFVALDIAETVGRFDAVAKRFRYDDIKEVGAVLAVETGEWSRRYYPWPGAPDITVGLPAQSRIHGSVNWSALGDVHPGRAAQFAKALRLAVHEITLAGSVFDLSADPDFRRGVAGR